MKITVKAKEVEIEMDDQNTESFNRYDSRVDFVIKIVKAMTDECLKLLDK
jgi:hypothetical protein